MSSRIPLLAGLLLVQILLIGLVSLNTGGGQAGEPFLAFDGEAVTAMTIGDAEGETVSLSRTDDGWRVGDLPADQTRIQGVIDDLLGGSVTWPVATSASSQERFEVTSDKFQRHLTFSAGEQLLAELYLGSSPGFRRIHARSEDSDDVFSIDFAVHEVPVNADDWLDKKLLHADGVSAVALEGSWRLEKTDDVWRVDGQAADEDAARRLVERIEGLSVLGLYDADGSDLGETRSLEITDGTGIHRLTLRMNEAEDEYVLTTDRFDAHFIVASYIAEQILIERDDLVAPAASVEAPAASVEAPAASVTEPASETEPAGEAQAR
jgi:hypothetical protein